MTLNLSPEEKKERRKAQLRMYQRKFISNPENKARQVEKFKGKYDDLYKGRYRVNLYARLERLRFIKALMNISI